MYFVRSFFKFGVRFLVSIYCLEVIRVLANLASCFGLQMTPTPKATLVCLACFCIFWHVRAVSGVKFPRYVEGTFLRVGRITVVWMMRDDPGREILARISVL